MHDTENPIIIDSFAQPKENIPGQLTPTQIEKVVDENGELYRRDVWKTSWKIRSQGLWAGGGLGIFFGAAIGAITALSPLLVGVSFAAVSAMLLPVVGAFAVGGMVTGIAALTTVGLSAGAAIGAEKVADRKKLLKSPTEELQSKIRYQGTVDETQTFWNRIIPFTKGSKKIFNVRNALFFGAAGLAVGGLLCGVLPALGGGVALISTVNSFVTGAIVAAHSSLSGAALTALTTKAITCMTFTTCGLFGAWFGVDMPTITANATAFVADIFSGKAFERSKGPSPELAMGTEVSAASIPRSAQKSGPVIFGSTSSTLISPIGAYAGQKPAKHMRMLAEQRFNAIQLSRETTIN